jgi:putative transposase
MTEDRMALVELLQKSGDADFLLAVAEAVLQILMEADVEGLIGAGRHESTGDRLNYRNGYRDRSLETWLGTLSLRIPKLRQGSYFPPFLERRKTAEKALVTVIQEAWIGGVSTRRVEELVQAMGLSGISKSQVSKLCKDIDERVNAFLDRPIDGEWPYLWLDATYLKVRDGGRIVSVGAIIAVAVNTEGRREIIGIGIGPSEAEPFWSAFLEGPGQARPRRRQAGDLRRARGLAQRHYPRPRRHLAEVSGALDEKMPAARAKRTRDGCRRDPAGVLAARRRCRAADLATRRRSAAPALAQARCADGPQRARRLGLHGLPQPSPDQITFHQSVGAVEQGGQAAG